VVAVVAAAAAEAGFAALAAVAVAAGAAAEACATDRAAGTAAEDRAKGAVPAAVREGCCAEERSASANDAFAVPDVRDAGRISRAGLRAAIAFCVL
jgi:hypothetical protein